MVIAFLLTDLLALLNVDLNYYFIIYLAQIFEIFVCSLFFTIKLKKRSYFPLRMIIYIASLILLGYILSLLRNLNDTTILRILYTFLLYTINMTLIAFVYRESILTITTSFIRILGTRETVDMIYTLILAFSGLDNRMSIDIIPGYKYLNCFIYDLSHIIFQFLFALAFNKKVEPSTQAKKVLIKYTFLGTLMLLFMVIIKTFVYVYEPESYSLYVLAMILTGLLAIGVLFAQRYILKENYYQEEIKEMNHIMYLERKQYLSIKENVDIINMKCHDIKHQLEAFQNKLTNEDIALLKNAVDIYDKTLRTGNKNLDIVLYEKQLVCDAHHIKLTCLADGKVLSFIDDVHLYSLMNNILSNSIESVQNLSSLDKKLIGLNIYQENNQAVIEEYNYYQDDLSLDNDGLISTSKENKSQHGLGLRSIRYIVNYYQGKMDIHLEKEDKMFFITIKIPIIKT